MHLQKRGLVPELHRKTSTYLVSPCSPSSEHHLPVVLLTNVRSLHNKIDELMILANTYKLDNIALTETWFGPRTPSENFNLPGFSLFSRARQERTGGGVALYAKHEFKPRQLPVNVPDDIEALWVLMRPCRLPRQVSCLIICVVYYPPCHPSAEAYIDHIVSTIDSLLLQYPEAGISIVGDFNDLDVQQILNNQQFTQVVTQPTRGHRTLDKIITNYPRVYASTIILPPIASSDHNCVMWMPVKNTETRNTIRKKIVRPLPDSGLRAFGSWITNHTWEDVLQADNPSTKCDMFLKEIQSHLELHLPPKIIHFHESDKPWINGEIKSTYTSKTTGFYR